MTTQVLATKLYIPAHRPKIVSRPRLIQEVDEGLHRKMTLVSAPAGSGKTTLVSEWASATSTHPDRSDRMVAWLSLDAGDSDFTRFLYYLITSLQTVTPSVGRDILGLLESPQPPPMELLLTALLNEINVLEKNIILVLDDYHLIDSKQVDEALAFMLENLPPCMHLIITTREDPDLPLARMRARDELTELRVADLSFTYSEAVEFLNVVMGLRLSQEDVAALETRTEGWIAGLQLAAISMRGQKDPEKFIQSFTGSHHYVLDYLVEEVIKQQPVEVQNFLLNTSILERMCGSLCDAVMQNTAVSGQHILEYLEQSNLFIIPLDNERQWYRYHHLFADLLRQRLQHNDPIKPSGEISDPEKSVTSRLHIRASQWYEAHDLELEAFQHAAAAQDFDRAERLIAGKGMPLHFRGTISPILRWLEALPESILNSRPSLWVTYAAATMISGHPGSVEPKLQAAEAALASSGEDTRTRDLVGQIAAYRSLVAASRNETDTIISQAKRALELLDPANVVVRTITSFSLAVVYELQNDRVSAARAYNEVLAASQASGNFMFTLAGMSSLATLEIVENRLPQAFAIFQEFQKVVSDPRHWILYEPYFGLARIYYEWNDLENAEKYAKLSLQLAPQIECGTAVSDNVLLARVYMAQENLSEAAGVLAHAMEMVCQPTYTHYLSEVIQARVDALIRQGNLNTAADLARQNDLPEYTARVSLARGDSDSVLTTLEPLYRQVEAMNHPQRLLKISALYASALFHNGKNVEALEILEKALIMGKPGGFIRTFLDEGESMWQLLIEADNQGIMPDYTRRLLAAFSGETAISGRTGNSIPIDSLSQRELEVLRLIAQGLSNREIAEKLYLALSTVKGHSRMIFDKLHVQRRTEAVAKGRELGLL